MERNFRGTKLSEGLTGKVVLESETRWNSKLRSAQFILDNLAELLARSTQTEYDSSFTNHLWDDLYFLNEKRYEIGSIISIMQIFEDPILGFQVNLML